MDANVDYSLRKVVRGTVVALTGSIFGLFLVFLSRILMARYLSVAEYGIFSLSYVILSLLAIVALLGLDGGVSRQVAFSKEKGDTGKVGALIRSSVAMVVVSSLVVGSLLFVLSDAISWVFLQSGDLAQSLRIFALGLPFMTLLLLFASVYRGFDRADMKVYFSDVSKNLLFVLVLIVVIALQLPYDFVVYGFVLAVVVSCVGIITVTLRKPPVSTLGSRTQIPKSVHRDLLLFSLPLLVSAIFSMIMSWTDTLVIGFYMTSDDVGIYNAALPIALFVPIILNGMSYIYLPVVSGLFSQNRLDKIRRMYTITTKWVFSLTYPFFLVIVLFPRPVMNLLFGPSYLAGSIVLQVLVVGFFVHTFLGLNASTLLSLGETKYLMLATVVASVVNIVLNVVLVGLFGIIGAATATALSLILLNILISSKCYGGYKIHPFTRKYLIPILVSIPIIIVVYMIVSSVVSVENLWLLPLFFVLFLAIYLLSILLTKGFDREDLDMIASVERKLGLDFKHIKRILKRFL